MPTPLTHHYILLALLPGERHGYALMQDVEKITGGTRMGPGTLYGAIKRLLETGLVEEAGEHDDPVIDERRRYYRITRAGRRAVAAETERLQRLVEFAHGLRGKTVRA